METAEDIGGGGGARGDGGQVHTARVSTATKGKNPGQEVQTSAIKTCGLA